MFCAETQPRLFLPRCSDHTWDAGLAPGAPGHDALFNTDSRPGVAEPAVSTFEGSYYRWAGQRLRLSGRLLASGLQDNGGEEELESFLYYDGGEGSRGHKGSEGISSSAAKGGKYCRITDVWYIYIYISCSSKLVSWSSHRAGQHHRVIVIWFHPPWNQPLLQETLTSEASISRSFYNQTLHIFSPLITPEACWVSQPLRYTCVLHLYALPPGC